MSLSAEVAVRRVELEASRPSPKKPWQLDAQAGVSVNAATDIEVFGRQLRKPKEFTLFEVALTKKGEPMGDVPTARPETAIASAESAAPDAIPTTSDGAAEAAPEVAATAAPAAPAPSGKKPKSRLGIPISTPTKKSLVGGAVKAVRRPKR